MSKVIFNNKNAVFFQSLKMSTDKYFKEKELKKTGTWGLYLKTIILIAAAITLYVMLISFTLPVAAVISMALVVWGFYLPV